MESAARCRTGRRGACLMKTFDNETPPSYLKVSLRHRIGRVIEICRVAVFSLFWLCRRRPRPCAGGSDALPPLAGAEPTSGGKRGRTWG